MNQVKPDSQHFRWEVDHECFRQD